MKNQRFSNSLFKRGLMGTLHYFYSAIKKEKPGYLFLMLCGIFLNSAHPFVNLILPKFLIDELTGAKRIEVLGGLVAGITIGNLFFLVFIHIIKCNIAKYDDWFERYFLDRLSEQVMSMNYALTEDPDALDQFRKASNGMAWYSGGIQGLSECFQMIVSHGLTALGVIYLVSTRSPMLLLVILGSVACSSLTVKQMNKLQKLEFEKFPKVNRAFDYISEDLTDIRFAKSIRLYNALAMIRERGSATMNEIAAIFYETATFIGRWKCFGTAIDFIKNICIYGYLGYRLLWNAIGLGDFTMLATAANTLKDSVQGIINQFQELNKKLNFMHEYEVFMKYEQTKADEKVEAGEVNLSGIPIIEFRHVSFRYPLQGEYILKDINITIRPGEHLSVVGLNGTGKTTFIKLLCRLYDIDEGEITMNGINIKDYPRDRYLKLLAVVFQDFKMFSLSLKENVKLADWDRETGNDDERIAAMCRLSGLEPLLNTLPRKLDTQIHKYFDESGIEPSGGELQKMAIARALYKDAPIVILDEPTAALDPLAEYEIYKHFDLLAGNKTSIYISHRLSSCRFCDRIVVFADKTIKERGTHEELVRKEGGLYAEMFRTQAQYYQ